jgi:putative hydrolase of the HAD superfamily
MSLSGIRGIIWDLDGTLYRFDELFKHACNVAAARAACNVRPAMLYEETYARCVASEREHGFSLHWFHQETQIPYPDMHFVYHDAIDETVIQKNAEMAEALRGLHLPSVILTNASRGWVMRILAHLGMDDLFEPGGIIALEDANFTPKGRGTAGFDLAIAKLGLSPSDILMVEDLPRNLMKAKEAGLKTALVHHGQKPDDGAYIDYLYDDTLELVRALAA